MKIFVPGRICLFGEHSDWAGGYRRINAQIEKGYTIITGTNQGIRANVEPHPSKLIVTSRLPDGTIAGPYSIAMDKAALLAEAEKGGFFSYIAGVAYQVLTHYHVKGLVLDCHEMDLPVKKGLSSSAAVCVLTARAFNQVYDLKMTTRGEMEAAYQGEILTPSRCGRMDQGCAFGQRPLLMTFDGDLLHVQEIPVKQPLYLIVVDLHAGKDTMEILSGLNRSYPLAQNALQQKVHDYLGRINKEIVHEAVDAIREGDARKVGELMTRAQSLFDEHLAPACPAQLTAPVLHKALSHAPLRDLVWGGKGVGSQGDGTAQFIARDAESRERAIAIIEKELGMSCLRLDIAPPDRVRKAVIPVAGFGTRLYPASKATKKELFPIVDRDGVAKPVIQLIVEEALSAGIEEVCLICQKEDVEVFDAYFNGPIPIQHANKLPNRFRDYAAYLADMGRRVRFVVQDKQDGFGHAVYSAREWVDGEPFLLLLGDHLYRSNGEASCSRQLLDLYERHQLSAVGVMKTPEDEISRFGTVMGEWIEDQGNVFAAGGNTLAAKGNALAATGNALAAGEGAARTEESVLAVSEFAEKPTADYAREKLRVEGIEAGRYLTLFGLYVLKPAVFDILEEFIENNLREKGEFQLTSALEELRKRDGFLATLVDGRRFDIGTPEAYVETVATYCREETK